MTRRSRCWFAGSIALAFLARLTAAAVGVLMAACSCSDLSSVQSTSDNASDLLQGEIVRTIADREDGTSDIAYFIRLGGDTVRPIRFDHDPRLSPYTPVTLWGRLDGETFVVSRFVTGIDASGITTRSSALVAATPAAPRKVALVLVDTGPGVNLTADQGRQLLFDANFFAVGQGSIRRYYQEDSYGVQDITGDVYGPIPYTPASTCDTLTLASALRGQVDQMAGGRINHYLWYFGSRQAGCAFQGLAAEGTPDRPQRDTWYNASAGCVVLVQEPGHNFGMQHSSAMVCPGGQTFIDAPNGICAHVEYGDPFDPMGSGCRHMNAWQKAYEGWLQGCNGVKVTSSDTFTLLPLETSCNGIQMLQVPMANPRSFAHMGGASTVTQVTDTLTNYTIELRGAVGFDQGLAPMVLVHAAGDLRGGSMSGLHTWLLDMAPATASLRDAALVAGQTFTDPAGGVSITAVSVSAAQASIRIDIANGGEAPTCLDGTTLVAPGPTSCGNAATGTGGETGSGGTGGGGVGGLGAGGAAADSTVPALDGGGAAGERVEGGTTTTTGPGASANNMSGGCSCSFDDLDGGTNVEPSWQGSWQGSWILVAMCVAVIVRRRRLRARAHDLGAL